MPLGLKLDGDGDVVADGEELDRLLQLPVRGVDLEAGHAGVLLAEPGEAEQVRQPHIHDVTGMIISSKFWPG